MGVADHSAPEHDTQLVVSGWLLEERLGQGSYGEVWRARRRHVDLVRALKLVRIVDDHAFEGWREEILRLEELSHPNVVRFYDADIASEGPYRGHAWIATELCDRSLAAELRHHPDGRLPRHDCDLLVEQMLSALSAARSLGCVHRDIKPANILVHRSGAWKLCDFGTARLLPTGGTHLQTTVIGTSRYMSAAALRGQQDHAADLYALGVTVHEALSGQLLHPYTRGMSEVDYAALVVETSPTVSTALPPRWRTVVEALIGQHGKLDAAALSAWFDETAGRRPPGQPLSAPGSGSGSGSGAELPAATAATAAATAATEAVGPNGSAVAPSVQRYYVPAPATPSAPLPSPSAGVAARPAPTPLPMASGGLRVAWARRATAVDPTGMLRRRASALVIDVVVTYLLALLCFHVFAVNTYEQVPAAASCADITVEGQDCYVDRVSGINEVYVAEGARVVLARAGFYFPFLAVFVLLQGRTGYTPGKLLRGIRAVGADWRPPGRRRALIRTVLWVVDGLPCFVPLLGLVVAARRHDIRRVGDLAAKTYVVRRSSLPTPPTP